ncbi:hypothetical protein DACRYDRAFT_25037 [Dacryopinax primogenitus]|uniref:Uncharacterized protein n=1 Tax=Dacryopinax primogenitus (strain DJM 731) TaxID=1858805 RepID=M5FQF6_DACPD|nr:uncharacterized protein DACRYDRAFT_25037 [Dacryopinax primogenitus]EJT97683.1 hypothetical protein DACRYDRAFT_25037 [Dacryopinax primogenitus]
MQRIIDYSQEDDDATPMEIEHDPFTPNTLYIAVYATEREGKLQEDLGMMFCAVTPTAGTYFIAQPRPADGKFILNMTSTYPADYTIRGWYPIGNRPVEYRETTTANGKVNGVRRDITTGESWLWTARLLRSFSEKPDTINWGAVIPVVVARTHIMSDECIENMVGVVPGLEEAIQNKQT